MVEIDLSKFIRLIIFKFLTTYLPSFINYLSDEVNTLINMVELILNIN